MTKIILKLTDYPKLLDSLTDESWIVACFCAGWCNACRDYKPGFKELASRYPEVKFLWIDIEDHADLLGDLDVENFPTLLMQRGDIVNFFSPIHPDPKQAERLLQSHMREEISELKRLAGSSPERQQWQENSNLRKLLQDAI